eukprot:CAMPEP_0116029582 /NCGR_PEP_ID=MMETSP0321-20121206/16223_1 /TAXON_ID=163516 /ORGANISM="Leptocylindrus danicus var. danicus, Strain B650" /LENGTH=442 /DNA_ID=CAMNT_0003503981 /DNA_START=22 /DNA_END=1351 /DNA_ORIENTATION=+
MNQWVHGRIKEFQQGLAAGRREEDLPTCNATATLDTNKRPIMATTTTPQTTGTAPSLTQGQCDTDSQQGWNKTDWIRAQKKKMEQAYASVMHLAAANDQEQEEESSSSPSRGWPGLRIKFGHSSRADQSDEAREHEEASFEKKIEEENTNQMESLDTQRVVLQHEADALTTITTQLCSMLHIEAHTLCLFNTLKIVKKTQLGSCFNEQAKELANISKDVVMFFADNEDVDQPVITVENYVDFIASTYQRRGALLREQSQMLNDIKEHPSGSSAFLQLSKRFEGLAKILWDDAPEDELALVDFLKDEYSDRGRLLKCLGRLVKDDDRVLAHIFVSYSKLCEKLAKNLALLSDDFWYQREDDESILSLASSSFAIDDDRQYSNENEYHEDDKSVMTPQTVKSLRAPVPHFRMRPTRTVLLPEAYTFAVDALKEHWTLVMPGIQV